MLVPTNSANAGYKKVISHSAPQPQTKTDRYNEQEALCCVKSLREKKGKKTKKKKSRTKERKKER